MIVAIATFKMSIPTNNQVNVMMGHLLEAEPVVATASGTITELWKGYDGPLLNPSLSDDTHVVSRIFIKQPKLEYASPCACMLKLVATFAFISMYIALISGYIALNVLSILYPVWAYHTHKEPYVSMSAVTIFTPLIAVGVINIAIILLIIFLRRRNRNQ